MAATTNTAECLYIWGWMRSCENEDCLCSHLPKLIFTIVIFIHANKHIMWHMYYIWGLPSGSVVRNPSASAGDTGSIPGSEGSPGEGNGKPPEYSCLGNSMGRGAWQASVQSTAKHQTRLSNWACTHACETISIYLSIYPTHTCMHFLSGVAHFLS